MVGRLENIFQNKAKRLYWQRIPPDRVAEAYNEEPIARDQAYFLVTMREMYIAHTRILWRKFYPMLHGFVSYGGKEEHIVVGPGQLREFGEFNLDRVVTFNYRLAGPIAYKGGDVTVLVGLYSAPFKDAAGALIDTVSLLANLGGLTLGQAPQIAGVVKGGVEKILELDETRIEIGVRDTFYQGNPFNRGYYLGVNAAQADVPLDRLWLKGGRLLKGNDPVTAKPFEDFDYFVLEIERVTVRDDWAGLPGIAELNEKFRTIMKDSVLSVKEKRQRLAKLWPEFQQALIDSPYLVKPHREKIAFDVQAELKKRLDAMEHGNPFESRAWSESVSRQRPAEEFDFVEVADYLNENDPKQLGEAKAALERGFQP